MSTSKPRPSARARRQPAEPKRAAARRAKTADPATGEPQGQPSDDSTQRRKRGPRQGSAKVLKGAAAARAPKAPPPQPVPDRVASPVHAVPAATAPSSGAEISSLLNDLEGVDGGPEARRRAAAAIGEIAARLGPELSVEAPGDDRLLSTARQLLSTDYYMRQWGRLSMRGRSEHVDEFGLDPTYEARLQPLLEALYERYFRVRIEGVERLPREGGALLVCNHSGTLPWDGVMLKTAIRRSGPKSRSLRWLIEDFVFHSPFVGPFLNRLGAVRACPENAQRLLLRDALVAVFPEGVKGVAKPYRERYQLQRFGRGGHVRLALRMGVPLLPVAIVGAEETYPLLYKVRSFSKLLGLPFIPVTPTFPWLGPLGLLPLPSRWWIEIGEPIGELEGLTAADADNSVRVNELNDRVRSAVQAMVNRGLSARGAPFL